MTNQNHVTTATKVTDTQLGELFINQLHDIYWAEQHLVKVIPDMLDAATAPNLRQALSNHLEQTRQHVTRLENVFNILGEDKKGEKCKAMSGITDECDDMVDETEKGTSTRDAAIVMAAQKVEHYEIATYGSLIQLAETLEVHEVADILKQTLSEEKEADHLLSQVAKSGINANATNEIR